MMVRRSELLFDLTSKGASCLADEWSIRERLLSWMCPYRMRPYRRLLRCRLSGGSPLRAWPSFQALLSFVVAGNP